jgi:hypothetical protein
MAEQKDFSGVCCVTGRGTKVGSGRAKTIAKLSGAANTYIDYFRFLHNSIPKYEKNIIVFRGNSLRKIHFQWNVFNLTG